MFPGVKMLGCENRFQPLAVYLREEKKRQNMHVTCILAISGPTAPSWLCTWESDGRCVCGIVRG